MKFINISSKINLFLLFSSLFFLIAVNSVTIKKVGSKTKLDEMQKRDVLIMMAKQYLFADPSSSDDSFRSCIDDKQATTSFWKSVDGGKIKSALESIATDCKITAKQLPEEKALKAALDNLVETYVIKYAAVDGIISSHRGSIDFNIKAINSPN
jgi:hypothetical protein